MSNHTKDVLIGKYLSGNATAGEIAELTNWRQEKPEHEMMFMQAEKVWKTSSALKKEADADVDAAWSEFRQLTGSPQPRVIRLQPLRVAAVLALVISTFFLVRFFYIDTVETVGFTNNVASGTDTVYEIPATAAETPDTGKVIGSPVQHKPYIKRRSAKQLAMVAVSSEDSAMVLVLPDNSRVYLNRHSKLTYPESFTSSNRIVHLSGEAYFEVSEGADPFFVYCRDTKSRALASAFNIRGHEDTEIEVSVLKGLVEVSKVLPSETRIIIGKGEKVTYDAEKEQFVQAKVAKKERWWKRASFRMKVRNFINRILHPGK